MKIIAQTAGYEYLCELTSEEVKLLNPDKKYGIKLGDEFNISLATQTLDKMRRFRKVDIRRTQEAIKHLIQGQAELSDAYETLMLLDDIENSENKEN
jgi:3-deoxy-D-manno-octulosonate 8-phosphate phosphatase KdsC-like HAD superfamily phosphatase